MKSFPYSIETITPLFLGGASPQEQAEIRAPSIRGQLRWWFRVLGGFHHLAHLSLREQEAAIFGTVAGEEGRASPLIVRVSGLAPSRDVRDDAGMGATIYDPKGYLLFPLRTQRDGTRKARAVFNPAATSPRLFELIVLWKGDAQVAPSVQALIEIFIHLGSLGFRGRRAMGALACTKPLTSVAKLLAVFNRPDAISIKQLPTVTDANSAIDKLALWLKSWRGHGRTGNNETEQKSPGFKWAKQDHDNAATNNTRASAYRPALGLPVMTKYGNWGIEPAKGSQPVGRFASPVILRPHRTTTGSFAPLVIFADAMRWPNGQQAYRGRDPTPVSTELYDAMRADPKLEALV